MSNKIPVLMFKDHPPLEALETRRIEQLKFLQKQKEDLRKKEKDIHESFWRNLYAYAQGIGINASEKYSYSVDHDVLYQYMNEDVTPRKSGESGGIGDFLKNLLT